MKKFTHLFVAIFTLLIFCVSCTSEIETDSQPLQKLPPLESEKGVRVAFSSHSGKSSTRALVPEDKRIDFPAEILRTDIDFSDEHIDITPDYFYGDVTNTVVYKPIDNAKAEKGSKNQINITGRVSDSMNHVNFMSDSALPGIHIPEDSPLWRDSWDGFGVKMLPFIGTSNYHEGYDAYFGGTFIGVKLPEGVSIRDVKGARSAADIKRLGNIDLDPDVAWFCYSDLIPTIGNFVDYFIFQTGIEKPYMHNPKGEHLEDYRIGCFGGRGNTTGICLPMEKPLDFSGYENPVINISYDMDEMVSLYPYKGTDGNWKYAACLNMDNPFAFEIDCEEYDADADVDIHGNSEIKNIYDAIPVAPLTVRRNKTLMALQFIKPNYGDIHHMEIKHSVTNNESDAEIIYEGIENCFMHNVDDVNGSHHYWISTVDSYGRKSKSVKFLPSVERHPNPNPNPNPKPDPDNKPVDLMKLKISFHVDPNLQFKETDTLKKNLGDAFQYMKDSDNLICTMTPVSYVLDMNSISLTTPADSQKPYNGTKSKVYLFKEYQAPQYSMMDFMKPLAFSPEINKNDKTVEDYTAINLEIQRTWYRKDSAKKGSYVIVKIPEGMDLNKHHIAGSFPVTKIEGYEVIGNPSDYIYIDWNQLFPTNCIDAKRIFFNAKITEPEIVMKNDHNGEYAVLNIPMAAAPDLTKMKNPEIRVTINPTNMIQVYKNPTQNYYHATLNLDKPFPIKVEIVDSAK